MAASYGAERKKRGGVRGGRWTRRLAGVWQALEELAEGFNRQRGLRARVGGKDQKWDTAERIHRACLAVGPNDPPPTSALEEYRALATRYPVVLDFETPREGDKARPVRPRFTPYGWRMDDDDRPSGPVPWLWLVLGSPLRARLRPCRQCGRWLIARGKNASRTFCRAKCKDAHWTREARRASQVEPPRRRRRRKRKWEDQ